MARRSGKPSARSQMGRATSVSSLAHQDPPSTRDWLSTLLRFPSEPFAPLDDGRYWHPDPEHGALTIGGRYARVVVHGRPPVARSKKLSSWIGGVGIPVGFQVPVGTKFESPLRVMTCVRRKVRREVIFARKKAGYGKKQRMPRRNWRSNIAC